MERTKKGVEEDAPAQPDSEAARPGGLLDPEEKLKGLPDIFRKVMTAGFSGLFTTEAAIRGALGDTLPREWVDFVAEQSERTRDEFIQRLAQEFSRVLESVDVVDLAEQLLEGRTVEVKAEFRLRPREESAKQTRSARAKSRPTVKRRASRTSSRKQKEEPK